MSTAAPANNRIVVQGLGLLVAACIAVAGVGALLRARPEDAASTSPRPPSRATRVIAAVDQAPWRVKTWPAGTLGRNLRAAEKVALRARPGLLRIVRRTYDAMFLAPSSLRKALSSHFTPKAARKLASSGAGVPRDATEVRFLKRRATITVDARGARRAAVQVALKARIRAPKGDVSVAQRSVLWLDRKEGTWKVIGFELLQRRIR